MVPGRINALKNQEVPIVFSSILTKPFHKKKTANRIPMIRYKSNTVEKAKAKVFIIRQFKALETNR